MLATTLWALLVAQSLAKDLVPHVHQQTPNENADNSGRLAYFDAKRVPDPHYKINFIYEQRKTNEITEIERIEEEIGKYMHHQNPSRTTTTTEAQQNIEVINEKDTKETTNHRPSESPIIEKEKHHHNHEEKEVTEFEQIEDEVRKYMQHHHPSTTKSTTEAEQNIEVINQKDIKETTTHRPSESTITEQENHHHKHEEKEVTGIEQIEDEIRTYMQHHHPSTTKSTTEAQENIDVVNQKDIKETTTHRPSESPIIEQEKHHHKHEEKQVTEIEQIEDKIRTYMQHHHPSTTKSTTEAQQNIDVVNQKDIKETTTHRPSESPIIEQEKHHHKHEEKQVTEIEQIEDKIRKYMQHHHPSTTKSTTEAQQNIDVVNQKDIKETTTHRASESPNIEQEKHHHKHEEIQLKEIKQIEEEIVNYMNYYYPSTTKSAKEALQNIEVVNQKDKIETTTHRPSESPIIEQENHHHKHEEKEVTEIEQIEEEIVKYIHYYHPSTMTTTTEAQYEIEVLNKKDIKDSSNSNTSETPITEPEKHEEKEAISTLPPPPKLREPFIGFHPHFRLSGRRPIPHRHPDHRIHIARTMLEANVKEEARTELSPSVTQSDDITTNNVAAGSQLDRQDLRDHKSKPFPHGHPYNRLHTSHAASKAPVEEETQTELSPPVIQSDEMREITNYDAAISQLDGQDLRTYKPKPLPHRHPNNRRLHISHPALETPVEEETQTELSPPVTQSLSDEMRETINYDGAVSNMNRQDVSAFEPITKPYRHRNHRLYISRTTSEAPAEVEAQPDLFPSVKQLYEMDVAPNKDIAESHLNRSDSLLYEPKPISHRHPVNWLHTSRITSAPIEEEARTDLSPPVTQSDEKTYAVAGSHLDRSNFSSLEPKAILHRHPNPRLHISSKTSEASVEEEVRTVTSPPVTESGETKEMNYIVGGSYLERPDSPSHRSDYRLHFSRITSEETSVEEETRTVLSPPVTQPDEMRDMYLDDDGAGSPDHRDFLTFEPVPISHRLPDYQLHVSRTTSESPVEGKAQTNNAPTDKRVHLSQKLHDPSFRHKDRHSFANIRPRLNDMHGSVGLAPRPVYRGSYKFSWDDIYDMHSSTAPKVSQLKENPTPPPIPTLSPWYDGYGK